MQNRAKINNLATQAGFGMKNLAPWEKLTLIAVIAIRLSYAEKERKTPTLAFVERHSIGVSDIVRKMLHLFDGATNDEMKPILLNLAQQIAEEGQPSKFIRVGNRIVNMGRLTNLSYDPAYEEPSTGEKIALTTASFSTDDCTHFYGEEAVEVWESFCKLCEEATS